MSRLVLLDGNGLFHRAYHAGLPRTDDEPPARRASDGTPTWAVYGFTRWLLTTISERKPDAMAVAFDVSRETLHRRQKFAGYKAHRTALPDDLKSQLMLAQELVATLAIPAYKLEGYEADDIIGTIATEAALADYDVEIVTGDRDMFQLVGDRISVLMPRAKRQDGESFLEAYDAAGVMARMGVQPDQIVDFKGLAWDASDGIPGVPGIGDKTAITLLDQFGSLRAILDDEKELYKKGLRAKLTKHRHDAEMSYELATIDCAVPIAYDLDNLRFRRPDMQAFGRLLARLEFHELAVEFGLEVAA